MWGDAQRRQESARRLAEVALPPGARLDGTPSRRVPLSRTPTTVLNGHAGAVVTAAFHPHGRLLATGDDRDVTLLWDVADPVRPVRIAALTPDGAPAGAARRDPARAPRRSSSATRRRPGRAVAFSPDGRWLATGHRDGTTLLWRIRGHHPPVQTVALAAYGSRAGQVRAVGYRRDGRLLATGYENGAVLVWDLTDPSRPVRVAVVQRRRWWLGRDEVFAVDFDPRRPLLAVGGFRDGRRPIVVWDLSDPARPARRAALRPAKSGNLFAYSSTSAYALAFSPDGGLLATGCDHRAQVVTEYGSGPVEFDSMVVLWDVTDPARPARTATLTQRGGARTDPQRHRRARAAATVTGHADVVRAVDFSPDGRLLATGSEDSTVVLWNVRVPAQPLPVVVLDHREAVRTVVFSPDGRLLVTGGATVLLWPVPLT